MILVFGKTGQVATELQRQSQDVVALGREEADLTQPDICAGVIQKYKPDAVINAAAYTAVDKAESDEETATLVNGAAPAAMAVECAKLGIPFVHISTDYVFDGAGDLPFSPSDKAAPIGAYGRSKLLGEEGVRAAGGSYAILRTSWVFSAHGNNFLKTMLRLGGERDKLTIVADQIGGPTSAAQIAHACLIISGALRQDPHLTGTYHFSGQEDVSWADFARNIFEQAHIACDVEDIPTTAFPTPAARPANSRMDCQSLSRFGLSRPHWKQDVTAVLDDLGVKE